MSTPSMWDKRFRQMLDAAPDAMIVVDQQGGAVALNREAERLLGWTDAEFRGEPSSRLIPQRFQQMYDALGVRHGEAPGIPLTRVSDATRQPIENVPARCLREGRAVDLTDGVLLVRRDGTEVPISDSAAPLRDRHGTTIGVVLVFHDVTERRRAARKLSHEATHDALTGLLGRKEFEERLARVLA